MEHSDIGRLIDIISWGKISIHYSSKHFILRPPTSEEKAMAALIYERSLVDATDAGILTDSELITFFLELGLWSEQQEQEIEGIKKDIHTIRRGLLDLFFHKDKLEKARQLLRNAEKALIKRLSSRQELIKISAETQAILRQQRYLISKITETEDGKPYWSSSCEFEEERDTGLVQQLCQEFFGISVPTFAIRRVAKSGHWKAIWSSAKYMSKLFANDLPEWSDVQRELVHWSVAYDIVYEAYERPCVAIIEDDDLLDSWFIRQQEKIDAKTDLASGNSQVLGKESRKGGRNERFIMSDKEGAKHIYNMNDPISRAKIRARQKVIHREGVVKEQHMPDSQAEMRQQLSERQRQHVKSIGNR